MLRVNAINRQELLKCLTFNPKSLVFKTVSVPATTTMLSIELRIFQLFFDNIVYTYTLNRRNSFVINDLRIWSYTLNVHFVYTNYTLIDCLYATSSHFSGKWRLFFVKTRFRRKIWRLLPFESNLLFSSPTLPGAKWDFTPSKVLLSYWETPTFLPRNSRFPTEKLPLFFRNVNNECMFSVYKVYI